MTIPPDWRALNQANWDERVAVHLNAPNAYRTDALRAGTDRLDPGDLVRLGRDSGDLARGIAWRTQFPAAYKDAGTAATSIVDFTRVRIVLHHSDGTVALDTVVDFTASGIAHDVLELHGYGVTSFAALAPFMTQSGADTLIAFDDQNHIVLHNVTMTQLTAGDFVLS